MTRLIRLHLASRRVPVAEVSSTSAPNAMSAGAASVDETAQQRRLPGATQQIEPRSSPSWSSSPLPPPTKSPARYTPTEVDGAFMQIRQAVGTTRARLPETVAFLRDLVEELKASGFVADALERSGQRREVAAPPA